MTSVNRDLCRTITFWVVTLTGLVWSISPAGADYDEGMIAFEKEDYAGAYREFRPLAESGVAEAQYALGALYIDGLGMPQDYRSAARWYREAAEQGLAEAQSALGQMYYTGQGVDPDYGAAAKWFTLAAEQGLADAMYRLAVLYGHGHGVTRNPAAEAMWLNRASERSLGEAGFYFGTIQKVLMIGADTNNTETGLIFLQSALQRHWTGVGDTRRSLTRSYALSEKFTAVEEALLVLGYWPGPADGVPDPDTTAAIRDYQRDWGLPETGENSDDLMLHLAGKLSGGWP